MNRPAIPIVGLMGGPGSGKSMVAGQFVSLGCEVIDSDALAREALSEPDVLGHLLEWWGAKIQTADGRVDRAAVAQIVFTDPKQRKRLEALIHPKVHARREALRRQALARPGVRAIIEDSPLLLETGNDKQCDVLVFVDAPLEIRRNRLARTRGWSPEVLAGREKNQLPLDTKRQRADYVISNDAGEAHCLEQTRHVLSRITH
jgi:dephospho-CoA kinase